MPQQNLFAMKLLLLSILIMLYANSFAQQAGYWTVKAGGNIKEALGDSVIFKYKQFTQGAVYFRDGTVSTAHLNLSYIKGEVEFIDEHQDTMAVTNESTTDYVVIEKDTFYFEKIARGFLELIHGNGNAKLGKQVLLVQGDIKKIGGYDQPSSTSSINSASYFSNGNQTSRLNENKLLVLHKQTSYFIGDNYNHFLPASKKSLRTMFDRQQPAIDSYLEENKNIFSNEAALIKLIDLLGK